MTCPLCHYPILAHDQTAPAPAGGMAHAACVHPGKAFRERVSMDDKPQERPLKERELLE